MKERILELRKSGYSYKKIKKELKCSLSTISYHCKNNLLNTPLKKTNKLSDNIIKIIIDNSLKKTKKIVAKEMGLSESTVYKYSKGVHKKKIAKFESVCLNCNNEIKSKKPKKFCNSKCCGEYKHKQSYLDFLNNNEKYNKGYYSPKTFKDFILQEQENKCEICKNEPIWMNKKLVFVIDHIDGDCSNNKRENLRLICPNCDSQTDTFKSKTKNSKRRNYIKENIIKKLTEGSILGE